MQQPPQPPEYPRQPYGAPPPVQPKKRKWPWWAWAIGIFLVLGICGGISQALGISSTPTTTSTTTTSASSPTATPTPATTPTPSPTPHPLVWTTVQTFSGNGNKKTATFSAPGDWKIIWKCDPTANVLGQYNIIVDVKNLDGSDLDPGAINTICKSGNVTGETEERTGGQVYLDVSSEDNWTIQIQVQK